MEYALFLLFAGVALAGAINLLRESHPIYSALSLVVVMCALAGLYLLLGAEFIAAVQLVVYAGAVMVLFVFTLMLLNVQEESPLSRSRLAWLGFPLLVALLAQLITILRREYPATMTVRLGDYAVNNTRQVGEALFRTYLLAFEVTSVLILVAIMGAVVLARRKR
jgi:NADH-quinone oxidoreductase subunit J